MLLLLQRERERQTGHCMCVSVWCAVLVGLASSGRRVRGTGGASVKPISHACASSSAAMHVHAHVHHQHALRACLNQPAHGKRWFRQQMPGRSGGGAHRSHPRRDKAPRRDSCRGAETQCCAVRWRRSTRTRREPSSSTAALGRARAAASPAPAPGRSSHADGRCLVGTHLQRFSSSPEQARLCCGSAFRASPKRSETAASQLPCVYQAPDSADRELSRRWVS